MKLTLKNELYCGDAFIGRLVYAFKYGFMHGFSPGSSQGAYSLHIRYEYGYALMRTMEATALSAARNAFHNYLNYLTWQQYANPDLRGFGGVSEHTSFRTYIQDTAHSIHSTQLPMIIAAKQ